MIAVSVIIPVYNAAPHLEGCIRSLISQKIEGSEFIFVNDGSTDNSRSIIEKFQSDDRIILINQQNQGVSAARNAGLRQASGTYIGFVDADDTIEPDMLDILVKQARHAQADIVVSRYVQHHDGQENISPAVFPEQQVLDSDYVKNNIIPYFIANEDLNAVWNKIYLRRLLDDHKILFPVGVPLGEDGLFNMQAFQNARTVYFTGFAGYHYCENQGSATRDFASKEYYRPIVDEYLRDYSMYENRNLDTEKINRLKAEKFLKKVVSLIHEYADPANKLGFSTARKKVAQLVNDAVFREVIGQNYAAERVRENKYGQFILWAARHKWVSLLFIAAAYSRLRNK